MDSVYNTFYNFYMNLKNKNNPVYIFFTTNYLHWVIECLRYIPKHVNTVLLGAGLLKEEKDWLKKNTFVPLCFFNQYIDDKQMWDILVKVNQQNFSWLDVDCFVFSPDLFDEISLLQDDISMNCIWSFYSDNALNREFVHTYFLHFNIAVYNNVKKLLPDISMDAYRYADHTNKLVMRTIEIPREYEDMLKLYIPLYIYPINRLGDSKFTAFFDGMLLYQLIADLFGYRFQKIRTLNNKHYFDNEIIHIGCSSYFLSFRQEENINDKSFEAYRTCLFMNYILFSKYIAQLPPSYRKTYLFIRKMIINDGIKPNKVKDQLHIYFQAKGISEARCFQLLNN